MVVLIITGALAVVFFLIAFKKIPSNYSFINDNQTESPNSLPDAITPTSQTSKNENAPPSQPTGIQNINPTTVFQTQSSSPTPTIFQATMSPTPTTTEKTKDKNTGPIYSSG